MSFTEFSVNWRRLRVARKHNALQISNAFTAVTTCTSMCVTDAVAVDLLVQLQTNQLYENDLLSFLQPASELKPGVSCYALCEYDRIIDVYQLLTYTNSY